MVLWDSKNARFLRGQLVPIPGLVHELDRGPVLYRHKKNQRSFDKKTLVLEGSTKVRIWLWLNEQPST
jgi:hypothetical protein